jgi:GNAT superfamily N-acetyltransferase
MGYATHRIVSFHLEAERFTGRTSHRRGGMLSRRRDFTVPFSKRSCSTGNLSLRIERIALTKDRKSSVTRATRDEIDSRGGRRGPDDPTLPLPRQIREYFPMQIIRATPQQADELTEIAHAAKRHWGYPERWIESWRDTLTIRPEFIAANVTYSAIEGCRAVGFYLLANENDGLHLDHFWIKPSAMDRGIGRALFDHALEQTRRLGHRSLKIEADPNAEGFYLRLGARRIGVAVTSIEDQRRELPLLRYDLA